MPNALRWILVAPAAVGATIIGFALMTLSWNVVRTLNIVPQEGILDLAMGNAWVNGTAAALGVVAGTHVAPGRSRSTSIVLAAVFALFAVLTLVVGNAFRDGTGMSLGWHVFSAIAWIAGAAIAAVSASKPSTSKLTINSTR